MVKFTSRARKITDAPQRSNRRPYRTFICQAPRPVRHPYEYFSLERNLCIRRSLQTFEELIEERASPRYRVMYDTAISNLIGEQIRMEWANMSAMQRQPYTRLTNLDHMRHLRECLWYQNTLAMQKPKLDLNK